MTTTIYRYFKVRSDTTVIQQISSSSYTSFFSSEVLNYNFIFFADCTSFSAWRQVFDAVHRIFNR